MRSVPAVQVCFTMDVERLAEKSPTGGPDNLETSCQAILGYCDLLRRHGFPATLFITPEAAEENRDVLLEVAGWGVELGLHLHPQSWRDNYLQPGSHGYLGGYTQSEQERMLREACAQWAAILGQQPLAVRPGNVSANDSTYSAMLAAVPCHLGWGVSRNPLCSSSRPVGSGEFGFRRSTIDKRPQLHRPLDGSRRHPF